MLAVIAGLFLAVNLVFAGLYLTVGGIAQARPGSFADAFFFSVQTLATLGYGEMHPVSLFAQSYCDHRGRVGADLDRHGHGLVFARARRSTPTWRSPGWQW